MLIPQLLSILLLNITYILSNVHINTFLQKLKNLLLTNFSTFEAATVLNRSFTVKSVVIKSLLLSIEILTFVGLAIISMAAPSSNISTKSSIPQKEEEKPLGTKEILSEKNSDKDLIAGVARFLSGIIMMLATKIFSMGAEDIEFIDGLD